MRVLIAARLSRKQARGKDGIGLDTQDEKSRAFCDREGYEVAGVTRDTITGSKAPMDRKELGKWVSDPGKLATYDAIVAYATDRLSRGIDTDWSRIETWAADNSKKLIIVAPDGGVQYPSRNDSDYWQWSAFKRQAGNELKDIKERTARAKAAIKAGGFFAEGNIPFGYVTTGEKYHKELTPTDEGKRLVPPLYAMVTGGATLAAAAGWLEAETGKAWWPRSIGRIIRNPVYMGYLTDSTGKIVHRCEPLVDAAVFKDAGEALAGRPKRGPQNAENRAALAGAIFCGNPGCTAGGDSSPMYRILCPTVRQGERVKIAYYRCAGRGVDRKGCGNMVRLDATDELFSDWAARELGDLPVGAWTLIPGRDRKAELEALKFEMRQLGARDLPWEEEDAERARLRAEYDRTAAQTEEKDRWAFTATGEMHANRWTSLPAGERAAYLRKELEIRVTARRDDSAPCGVHIDVDFGALRRYEALGRRESEIMWAEQDKAEKAAYEAELAAAEG